MEEIKKQEKEEPKRYVYKNQSLYAMMNKIKLWPARSGILHGIKTIEQNGKMLHITTHCGEDFCVWDSKNSRSARWLRNRWSSCDCKACKIPEWKLSKYSATVFTDSFFRQKENKNRKD